MRQELIKDNYIFVPGFISKSYAKELADSFYSHAKKFPNEFEITFQAPNSPSKYNFLPFVRLLVEKNQSVSDLVGEFVLPTYSYARLYQNQEELVRHVDRPACEISVTLNLSKDTDWPIFIERPDKSSVNLELEPGDAAIYLGCIAPHWRSTYTGSLHTQVFLHYVRANGPKSWAFFDKQTQQPPTSMSDVMPVTMF